MTTRTKTKIVKLRIVANKKAFLNLFIACLAIGFIIVLLGIFFPQQIPWGKKTMDRVSCQGLDFALQQEFDNFFGEQYVTYLYIKKGREWEQHQIDFESARWFGSRFLFPAENGIEVRHEGVLIATYNLTTNIVCLHQKGVVFTGPNQVMPTGWSPR